MTLLRDERGWKEDDLHSWIAPLARFVELVDDGLGEADHGCILVDLERTSKRGGDCPRAGLAAARSVVRAVDSAGSVALEISTADASYRLRIVAAAKLASEPNPRADAPAFPGTPLELRFGFTRKEAQVARLLAEGRPNKEIARALSVSPHTARHHTQHLMLKLGVRSRTEATVRILSD